MGKKGRKTRWRRLPIGGPESNLGGSTGNNSRSASYLPEEHDGLKPSRNSPEHRVTFNEDEYTKITTPRQDVLFKKGYLGRRRNNNPSPEAQEVHSTDSVESGEYIPEEPVQYYIPQTYIDPSGVYYVNNPYEMYDPCGNVAVVVGPAPQYPPQPVLAAMPCQPVPLNPLEWFNPTATAWMCPPQYNNRRKRYSTDSQNCSAHSSEPPGSPQELIDEAAGVMYSPQPHPYVYPGGYMFGAPLYNINGVNVQGVVPQQMSPQMPQETMCNGTSVGVPSSNSSCTTTKRRKKRRRKRRGGTTDEGSESSCEEIVSCDGGVCSQSGASSDAGQGSSCSKTNSDSGINTEPPPDSPGSNTPPLLPLISNEDGKSFNLPASKIESEENNTIETDNCVVTNLPEEQHLEKCEESLNIEDTDEIIPINESTPKVVKQTCETSLTEDIITIQEVDQSLKTNNVTFNNCKDSDISSLSESFIDVDENKCDLIKELDCATNLNACEEKENREFIFTEEKESVLVSIDEKNSKDDDSTLEDEVLPSQKMEEIFNSLPDMSIESDYTIKSPIIHSEVAEIPSNYTILDENISSKSISEIIDSVNEMIIDVEEVTNLEELNNEHLSEVIPLDNIMDKEVLVDEMNIILDDKILCNGSIKDTSSDYSSNDKSFDESIPEQVIEEITRVKQPASSEPAVSELPRCNYFTKSERSTPIPPPRRKRSLYKSSEKVAIQVVEEAIQAGIKEAACSKCRGQSRPITEAVTRWLESQGCKVLSQEKMGILYQFEEDEGIEECDSVSTNQKNVEGNPFLAPYHNGSRQRVANLDDSGSTVSSAGEWDIYDPCDRTRDICDPAASVNKYYHLGADDPDDKTASSSTQTMIKTAVHIRHAGPFPCGVCCIIQ